MSAPHPASLHSVEALTDGGSAPFGLFASDALPVMPTPTDSLRRETKEACDRKRGTQSRLAEALGISRHTLANILAGRADFTVTAAAAIRRWLAGEPISADWPPLPKEIDDAA